MQNEDRAEKEIKAIYNKNYRTLYPLNETVLDRMAKFSEFPKELLDRLAKYFPEEDRELFYERCEQMHQIRVNAHNNAKQQNKE